MARAAHCEPECHATMDGKPLKVKHLEVTVRLTCPTGCRGALSVERESADDVVEIRAGGSKRVTARRRCLCSSSRVGRRVRARVHFTYYSRDGVRLRHLTRVIVLTR